MPTTLTHAFARGTVRRRDYPMVGTMRKDVIGEPVPVIGTRRYASIYPILGRLKWHFYFQGKRPYC